MKHNVLGVLVDETDYADATERIIRAARAGRGFAAGALAVEGVMCGVRDAEHRARLNSLDLVAPDGRPIRWALQWLRQVVLPDRVYGPVLAMYVIRAVAVIQMPVYFVGGSKKVLDRLTTSLQSQFPDLVVAGTEEIGTRDVREEEKRAIAERIRTSGAKLVLVGLGSPSQETFAFEFRDIVDMPILAVGATFDYHADMIASVPAFVRVARLSWIYRRAQHPLRSLRRYFWLNPTYILLLTCQLLGLWRPEARFPVNRESRSDIVRHV